MQTLHTILMCLGYFFAGCSVISILVVILAYARMRCIEKRRARMLEEQHLVLFI